jgi:flagellar biogenesis protein FliO
VLFGISAAFWTLAISAGRLTAYSSYVISRTVGALLVALVVVVVAALAVRALGRRREADRPASTGLAVSLKGE